MYPKLETMGGCFVFYMIIYSLGLTISSTVAMDQVEGWNYSTVAMDKVGGWNYSTVAMDHVEGWNYSTVATSYGPG